jgi:hypothetical protein
LLLCFAVVLCCCTYLLCVLSIAVCVLDHPESSWLDHLDCMFLVQASSQV